MPDVILKNLNPEQKKAVKHEQGPLLIIAGAGTGKTTVITHRIAHLIVNKGIRPNEILALTFTDKAAFQMQERVDILVPYGFTDTWISTFHAFGDRVLRENALDMGLSPDFRVMTRPQSAVLLRENLFKFSLEYYRPLGTPTKYVKAFISLFSRARDEDISCEEYLAHAQALSQKAAAHPEDEALAEEALHQIEIARCYQQYCELLLKEGRIDFANQFYLTLQLFRAHPSVLKYYQDQFRYILVDEFQDTNYAQFELVKLLARGTKNLTVVADDDQSIYKWRGAAVSNIRNFMATYPACEKVALTRNYRSTQKILDSAYRLIQNNNPDRFEVQAKINKRLVAKTKAGQGPAAKQFDTLSSESDWVAEKIANDIKKKKRTYRDFAVLVRSNSDAESFLHAFNMRGIPWQFSGNQGLYARSEVKLCISFLRLMANPADSLSLYFLATSSIYHVPIVELSRVMHAARRRNFDLYSTLKRISGIEGFEDLSQEFKESKDKILTDIEKYMELSRELPAGQLLYAFLTESGYLKGLVQNESQDNEDKIKNLAKFFDIIKEFEYAAKENRVVYFINYLDLLINVGDDPAVAEADFDVEAVSVLTIHKAKGLEFPVVFLVGLVEQRFPWPYRKDPIELPQELIKDILPIGDFHIQEERRLFYVGMTRAQKELYLTSATDYGTKRLKKVSRFVEEAVTRKKTEKIAKTSALESIERHAAGQRVAVVQSVTSDNQIINLSYFQIDDYLTCPLKYKYVHVLRVPIMAHHTVLYGKALHDAVQYYHLRTMKKESVKEDELMRIFEESFTKEGFLSQEHIALRMKSGAQAIHQFFQQQEHTRIIPQFVEKEFSFALGHNRIIGRWDRVDERGDEIILIDFKSSHIAKQEQADKRTKDSLQLDLYAMAYEKVFGRLPDFKELHFLETGLIGRAPLTEKNLKKAAQSVDKAAAGIRAHHFQATPSQINCTYCAFNQICPFAILR
ncbi:MAG: UvrD-helicase domain-containing protein [Candidatus Omnitrophota bacterium]